MLNLLPLRNLVTSIAALVGLAVLAAVYAGVVGTGNALADVKWIIRTASFAALALTIVPYTAWRWLPSLQRFTFPYLGGAWMGELVFDGPKGPGTRKVTLGISHSLLKIVLVLDSAESTSRTLVVYAERDTQINRNRLYYVYLNERKEGTSGSGERYRGLAILRIEVDGGLKLHGDYFTEKQGFGKLQLRRVQSYPWWVLWK